MRWLGVWGLAVCAAQAGEIPSDVVAPYTAESHPRIALKWGVEALPQINRLRMAAARRTAASRDCDRVAMAELYDLRSESPDLWTIAIDCENGRKYFLRQSDVSGR